MKKFLSLVLIACMMLSVAALGEGNLVVQDKQPPMIVTALNADNAIVEAYIYNAQGDVIAEIVEGNVILTDVHDRATVENATIKDRLTAALEGVMENVHHSNVTCELHEHNDQVDIDTVLGSLGQELDAHDLVMYELFDVCFGEAAEALLTDGNYARITMELASSQPMPLIVMFSADGVNWTVIPYTSSAAQQVTVDLSSSGTIALLCDGRLVMGIGEDPNPIVIPGDTTTGEESGNFMPSVSGKPAPAVEVTTGTDGETYIGVIGNDNDDTKTLVPNRNYVIVTALADRVYNPDIQTYEHLEWAYNSILAAENVGELPADNNEGNIAEDLNATLQEMGLDLTYEQLVVKDLFEVSAYGDYLHYLYDDAYYLEMTFDTDLNPDQAVVVIHSADSVHWHIHPIEEAVVHANGKITLRLYDLGTVALLVEADDALQGMENAVLSPN